MIGPLAELGKWLSTDWKGWEALSAIGSISATIVALFLPIQMARNEWSRQDRIRQADAGLARKQIIDVQHEVCSAVDRILAYYEASIAIFDSQPVSLVGKEAVRRIGLNVRILLDVLTALQNRQELSDGTLYSAAAAIRIGTVIGVQNNLILQSWATQTPNWMGGKNALLEDRTLAEMAKLRSCQVRDHYGLSESETAKKIREKYIPLSEKIKCEQINGGPSPENNLSDDYL
jgi:hypothetical protein